MGHVHRDLECDNRDRVDERKDVPYSSARITRQGCRKHSEFSGDELRETSCGAGPNSAGTAGISLRGRHVKGDAWLFAYCVVGSFVIFGAIIGLVFPEYAYFYRDYGNQGRPSLAIVLESFSGLFGGWYRPVSITAAPYLLGVDFLNPSSIVAMNVVFFALASYLAPVIFLPRAGLGAKLVTSSLILSAPALQSVSYFPTIDALYILFAFMAIGALDRACREGAPLRSVDYGVAVLSWALAVCSKEVSVLAPFVAVPVILLRRIIEGETPSWALFRKVARYCGPLAVASVVFYLTYLAHRGAFTTAESYSSIPGQESLRRLVQLVGVSLNMSFPQADSAWLRWVTGPYDQVGTTLRAILYLATMLFGAILVFSRKHWHVAGYAAVLLTLTIPLGLFAIHPHHAFPVIIVIALGVGAACSNLSRELANVIRIPAWTRPSSMLTALLFGAISLVLMHRAYVYNGKLLLSGMHAFQLRYNTELFNDDAFKAVIRQRPTFVLIEKCPNSWSVGSEAGVLNYFGRAPNALGEEYVDDLLPARVVELRSEVDGKGGQLVGLGCNFAGSGPAGAARPYALVNFSEGLEAIASGRDITLSTHPDLYRHLLLRKGWFDIEAGHVWSVGHQAIIEVPTPPDSRSITFNLGAYVPGQVVQTVDVAIDGAAVGTLTFDADRSRATVSLPLPRNPSAASKIDFNIRRPIAPRSVSASNDGRELGIALYGLRLE